MFDGVVGEICHNPQDVLITPPEIILSSHIIAQVDVHHARVPEPVQLPAEIIGTHVGTHPETPTSTSPAGQLTVDVPAPEDPPPVRVKESMPVVIEPGAISPLPIRPLVMYPRALTLNTPSVGPQSEPLSTRIPPVPRTILVDPDGDPSVVIRSSLNVPITLLIALSIARSACVKEKESHASPIRANAITIPLSRGFFGICFVRSVLLYSMM